GCSGGDCAHCCDVSLHTIRRKRASNADLFVHWCFHVVAHQDEAQRPMTEVIDPARPAPPSKASNARTDDSYDDVVEMFVALRGMPAESHESRRQRERIVARCLPLADHVASHFARRGEGHEDLVQVARLGLMNAVNRFDPEKGPSFIGFAVPTMMGEV